MFRASARRSLFAVILVFLAFSASVSASDEDGSVNYFLPMAEDIAYGDFCRHVFNGGALNGAILLYDFLEESLDSAPYDEWMKDLALSRASCILARYCIQTDKKANKEIARDYMRRADDLIAEARDNGAPESAAGVVEALAASFWYLVDGSLSMGMKFPKMVNALYKEHPEDFHVLLIASDRYLQAPPIAGGNKKKGLRFFQNAERVMDGCAEWDAFTVYAGLALGYDEAGDDAKAIEYAEKAYAIYKADPIVNEILGK